MLECIQSLGLEEFGGVPRAEGVCMGTQALGLKESHVVF